MEMKTRIQISLNKDKTRMCLATASVLFMSLVTGCGASMKPVEQSSTQSSNGSSGTGGGGTVVSNPAWQQLNMTGSLNGTVGGNQYANTKALSLDKVNKELIVTLPLALNPYLVGITADVPITQLPGAHVEIQPNNMGGASLIAHIPMKYVVKGVDFVAPSTLPNGDPLPTIVSGELPAMAVQLPNYKNLKLYLYMDVGNIGIFVNTPFNPLVKLGLPLRSDDGKTTWGYLTSIPAKNTSDGGFFLSVLIPDDIARIIDDNL